MHFRNKTEYLKIKSNEAETKSKTRNTGVFQRSINEVKKSYQPTSDLLKNENFNLLVHSHNTLIGWKKHRCYLLN